MGVHSVGYRRGVIPRTPPAYARGHISTSASGSLDCGMQEVRLRGAGGWDRCRGADWSVGTTGGGSALWWTSLWPVSGSGREFMHEERGGSSRGERVPPGITTPIPDYVFVSLNTGRDQS